MTPELKNACEVVFQEHKTSVKPITWNKDSFRGRLPFGLSAMAKEILVTKNIICFPNPEKKIITRLNPVAVAASNFEEADGLVQNRMPAFVTSIPDDEPDYIANPVNPSTKNNNYLFVRITGQPVAVANETKWYMRPLFYYVVWRPAPLLPVQLSPGALVLSIAKYFFKSGPNQISKKIQSYRSCLGLVFLEPHKDSR